MVFDIRRAIIQDVEALLAIKQAVWPDEAANLDRIRAALGDAAHVTLVAEVNGRIIGFVDSFMTAAYGGARRWEVDLLAAQPDYRGQGAARRLVTAATRAGCERGAELARALVAVDNQASRRVFAGCGYSCENRVRSLYLSSDGAAGSSHSSDDAYLIPVRTLNYRGVWLEEVYTTAAFRRAQSVCAEQKLDLAGALVPDEWAAENARKAGFVPVGDYRWWCVNLGAAPAPC
jgi:ribosomal protein S18 acetylase RimI-like enzyme